MADALDRVLRLVAEGRLTASEAAPILDALARKPGKGDRGQAPTSGPGAAPSGDAQPDPESASRPARYARIQVLEGGRRSVDLRIPISLGKLALARVPGLSSENVAEVHEAIASGTHGPILDIQDDDGDGVRIVLE